MSIPSLRRWWAVLLAAWCSAAVAGVGYVASGAGLVLQSAAGGAVMAAWRGQAPIQGFSGYGPVYWNGLCLTGRNAGEPLRWEGCRIGDRAQIWKLAGEHFSNELDHCARREHEGEQARVLAAACGGDPAQRWKAWSSAPAQAAAATIADRSIRTEFLRTVATVPAGSVISLASGRLLDAAAVRAGTAPGPKAVSLGAGDVIPLVEGR